jgi:hypothetical protein
VSEGERIWPQRKSFTKKGKLDDLAENCLWISYCDRAGQLVGNLEGYARTLREREREGERICQSRFQSHEKNATRFAEFFGKRKKSFA